MYIVPPGADDDWYWMFLTVAEGRKKPAYVVTNDLMRDHKLAFMEPRPFYRWRMSHVMNFMLYSNDDITLMNGNVVFDYDAMSSSISPHRQQNVEKSDVDREELEDTDEDFNFSGVIFKEPMKYSREIQQTKSKRWHFPATNQRAWLCIDVNKLITERK